MSGDLVELAQKFVRLSGELDSTRDAMKRLLMNGAGTANKNPTPARRPGAKRPQPRGPQAGEAILEAPCSRRREWERRRSPGRRRRGGRRRSSG